MPTGGRKPYETPEGAQFQRIEGDRAVYSVPSGTYAFAVRVAL
ncbi:hypothetical protein [Streptomyces sp. R41]|uniref:Uncharacterized protein n=1 Tax=Streptomyces sp. R41 TaxID=3238632 RepID=A0AB39R5X3_9ACTN